MSEEVKLKSRLNDAINYRIITHVGSLIIANEWGYKEGSKGYKESKEIFEEKFKTITFEGFKDEIILSWLVFVHEKNKEKRTMTQILGKENADESKRKLFNNICDKVKRQKKENNLTGISEEIINNKEYIRDAINNIDNSWKILTYKIKESRTNTTENREKKIDLKCMFDDNTLECLNFIGNLNCNIELPKDDEVYIEKKLKKIEHIISKEGYYTQQDILDIETEFSARIFTLPIKTKERERTKETIFDLIDKGNVDKISEYHFDDLIDYYKKINVKEVEGLMKFHNLESKYNLLFYINLAIDVFELDKDSQDKLLIKLSEMSLSDLYIYRLYSIRSIVNNLVSSQQDKSTLIVEEIKELLVLKSKIMSDLEGIYRFTYDDNKEEAFKILSKEYKDTLKEELCKLDIENYLDLSKKNKRKFFNVLKNIMKNNKNILINRSKVINEEV